MIGGVSRKPYAHESVPAHLSHHFTLAADCAFCFITETKVGGISRKSHAGVHQRLHTFVDGVSLHLMSLIHLLSWRLSRRTARVNLNHVCVSPLVKKCVQRFFPCGIVLRATNRGDLAACHIEAPHMKQEADKFREDSKIISVFRCWGNYHRPDSYEGDGDHNTNCRKTRVRPTASKEFIETGQPHCMRCRR